MESIVEIDTTELVDKVTVETRNFEPRVYNRLTEHIATEIQKLSAYGVTSAKVIAVNNTSYTVPTMSVQIMAIAHDKPFVVNHASEKSKKITDVYSHTQSILKDQLRQYYGRIKVTSTEYRNHD